MPSPRSDAVRHLNSALVTGLILSVCAGTTHGQTVWTAAVSSTWGDPNNWSLGIPHVGQSAQINGSPIAILTGPGATLDLVINAATAGVQINSGNDLTIHGTSVMNLGKIAINPSGGINDATIFFNGSLTISGTGSIVLNEFGTGVATDAGLNGGAGSIVTNAAGHTIRGNGYINASINNAGLLTCDINAREINLGTHPKGNSGLIVAQNGGAVDLAGITLTQTAAGVFRATGAGSIAEASGSIIGGTWEGVAGGLARTGGTLTLDSVTTSGEVHVISAHAMPVLNALNNTGTITINPSGGINDATISFNSPAITLNGGGTIVLNPVGTGVGTDAGINTLLAANVVTNPSGATIRGNGYINANINNQGLIAADISARLIVLSANPKSNSGQIIAQNGGTMDLQGITLTQTVGGTFRATGADSIAEASGSIIGGTWEGVAGGLARTGGNLILDGVTTNGDVHVSSTQVASVLNTLTNTGTITVNPSGGINDATISFNSPAITLNGGGTIVLNPVGAGVGVDAGINTNVATNVVTNPSDATIRGNGYINANINNAGLITCDIPARMLVLGINPKSNSGTISAQAGGTIDLNNITLTQSPTTGAFRAEGAGSIAEASGSIVSGFWEGVFGGLARTGGAITLDDVTLGGAVHLQSGHTATIQTGLTNHGTLTINPSGGINNASLVINSTTLTLDGTGTIVLNGVGSTNDANIFGAVTTTLTNASGHTIAGNGEINIKLDNAGILSPGHASNGDFTQTLVRGAVYADFTCTPTSVVKIDIEGTAAGQFDRITSSFAQADFVCGGTLDVSHINGFTGAPVGTTFDIITAIAPAVVTGEFTTVKQPTFPSGDRYVVDYLPQAVRLRVACYADCDGDGFLAIDDFICFQTLFALGDPFADCDGDAFLSIDDFICFQTFFAIGC